MKISYENFLDTVKVIRMLYGIQVATAYFEKNFELFTNHKISDLHKLKQDATILTTSEI